MSDTPSPAVNHARVKGYYDQLHEFYDTIFEETGYYNLGWLPDGVRSDYATGQKSLVSLVTGSLQVSAGGRLLEIGCGQGAPALQAARESGALVIGLELLSSQLKSCRKKQHDNLQFIRGDACSLPFTDSSFDGIYSIESAFHYGDKAAFIQEVARVLKPGSFVAIADIVATESSRKTKSLRAMERIAGAAEFFQVSQYLTAANNAGLELVRNEDITPGVSKSFRNTAWRTLKHWKSLRKSFPIWKLDAIITITLLHRYFYRWLPVRYQLLVFTKHSDNS